MHPADLLTLPGAPESRLHPEQAVELPAATPSPPWRCRVHAVLWWHRAPAGGLVVGALVRYLASPVGPYEELIGATVTGLPAVRIPFIAVDSPASVHGGRASWALPKTLATFARDPETPEEVVVAGQGWRVGVTPEPRGPRLPVAGLVRVGQADAAGRRVGSTATAYGRGRPARVGVQVGSDLAGEPGSIAGWLRSGRHPGLVLDARLRMGRATVEP